MIQDMMPGTEEQLQKELTSAYIGIDPTADSLHIGHMVSVMILKHFQNAGHRPIALIGGATGMIGDPSMKSAERNLLDEQTLRHNQECIKKQLEKFLDFYVVWPTIFKRTNSSTKHMENAVKTFYFFHNSNVLWFFYNANYICIFL